MNFARKCWGDLRWAWLASAGLTTAVIVATTAAQRPFSAGIHGMFRAVCAACYTASVLTSIQHLTAMFFSVAVAQRNFASSSEQFLFTRPLSRARAVWTAWAVGLSGLITMWLATLSACWILSTFMGSRFSLGLFLFYGGYALYAMASALVYYTMCFALSAALRNGWKGAGGCVLLFVCYDLWANMLQKFGTGFVWPSIGGPVYGLSLVASATFWAALAMTMVFAAHKVMQLREA